MPIRTRRAHHSGIDEAYWDRLDNAAKLFPAITNTRSPNVFRLTAVIKEEVDPKILQRALELALSIMPAFSLKLNRGLFWYYFDFNNEKPKVREERSYPCTPIYRARERGFLFRVTYFHRRINFEIYHALSDGMGAVSFMRLMIYCYYNLLLGDSVPEELIRREANDIARDFNEDSFVLNVPADAQAEKKKERDPEAYHISGYRYDGTRLGALAAIIPTAQLLSLAKSSDATVSEYLCALLIWSIYNTSYRRGARNKPIAISIPVNLRGMFDSGTLRNFFGHMTVAVMPERDASFESILDAVKARFAHCLNRSYFEDQMTSHVNIERIPGIKFVPLFIKDLVMKIIYAPNASKYTMTFSNVGRINLPENISDKVERFEMMIGGSHTHPKKASLISYKDELVLMFSSTIDDNSLERYLVSFLSERGIDITISSNETPPEALSKEQMAAKAERAAAKRSSKESKSERKRLKKQDKLAKKLAKKRMKLEKKAERKALKDKKNESKKQTAAIKNASKRNKGSSSDAEVDA